MASTPASVKLKTTTTIITTKTPKTDEKLPKKKKAKKKNITFYRCLGYNRIKNSASINNI